MTKIKQFIYHDKMNVGYTRLSTASYIESKRKILGLLNITKSLATTRADR